MSLVTRTPNVADLDVLVAIEDCAFPGDRLSRRSFVSLLYSPSASIVVAEKKRHIVGYAAVLFRKTSLKARLYSIAVAPGSSGVGRRLLAAAEDAARMRGSAVMRLEVRADNDRAISLYKKNGYHEFDRKPAYYADGASALRLQKDIDDTGRIAPPGRAMQGTARL